MSQRLYQKCFYFILVIIFLVSPATVYARGSKRVEINLGTQNLYAYEGESLVYNFLISSGKPWWPTPTGTFYPWAKLPFERMRGGSSAAGTYYDLPNVPNTIYFYRGYAIHGAYWHNNFGVPMSHGCVNLRLSDASLLYDWIDLSTPITIYGVTPVV